MTEVFFLNPEMNGTCYLVRDEENVLIFDPGMAWNAPETMAKVREKSAGRQIRGIFLTHSHYDHISAIPYFKKAWPDVPVYAAAYAAKILEKPSARVTMRHLAEQAAENNGIRLPEGYDEALLRVDETIADGQTFDFGSLHMVCIECIGHTKDSYSFVINDHTMIAAETLGILYEDGTYQSEFLVSSEGCRKSLEKCAGYEIDYYGMSHLGPTTDFSGKDMWRRLTEAFYSSRDRVREIVRTYPDFEDQMKAMEQMMWSREIEPYWPYDAFYLNAQAMLKTIAREEAERQGA